MAVPKTAEKKEGCSVKICIMTDMEGVCGVLNYREWCVPGEKYYDEGRMLLTLEVNAAVEGFFAAGATKILVIDGHGAGGINQQLLDDRTYYLRYYRPLAYPFTLDESYDAIAWVGKHAKAGAEFAHIAHTGWFDVVDYTLNGISVGEFGQMAYCAISLGIKPIFGSGDEAFIKEAADLVKGIETVSVKKGLIPGCGDGLDCKAYEKRNLSAVHMHPIKAREQIRIGAEKSLRRFLQNREAFYLQKLIPPYKKHIKYRNNDDIPAHEEFADCNSNIIELLNN